MDPAPDLSAMTLKDVARAMAERRLPPVEQWNPERCGHSGMRIARDGTWWHEGAPICRPALKRLFSTVLRREPDGRTVLVTPAEKLDIDVDDAAFQAVEMRREGSGRDANVAFRLDTGDLVTMGPDHALRVAGDEDAPRPYLHVRGGLEALIARPLYYDLAEIAVDEAADGGVPGVWSGGAFFPIMPAA